MIDSKTSLIFHVLFHKTSVDRQTLKKNSAAPLCSSNVINLIVLILTFFVVKKLFELGRKRARSLKSMVLKSTLEFVYFSCEL